MSSARRGWLSGIVGVVVAGLVFAAAQAWDPPHALLEHLGAGGDASQPAPTNAVLSARLGVSLLAGFVALMVTRILTRR
ncbi:MAG: hypothetical protein KA297_16200 [Kofleriaceae bacterium]|jgi:hypothetical protein|nr:hypothetical protein [Kofleriaceae bacterium]MBP6840264.1 hypothetical protein [Kofleriaceae bacterium]